jgi:hypothetical protein
VSDDQTPRLPDPPPKDPPITIPHERRGPPDGTPPTPDRTPDRIPADPPPRDPPVTMIEVRKSRTEEEGYRDRSDFQP